MTTIDEKVVSMKFDNKQFNNGVQSTVSSLDQLQKSLDFKESKNSLSEVAKTLNSMTFNGIAGSLDTIASKFNAVGVIGVTILSNITNSAINAGKRIASALTIDPLKMGFQEYETQINAIQTILSNTSHAGITLDQVKAALDELNKYADMTIYNFTEMTRNIGTFTAAGVDLETSVQAIKGIANLAAISGSTSQQASTAMYQLSQAIASGVVNLQDWNSVVNAGMGGKVFQNALIETAEIMGIAVDKSVSFRESISARNGKTWLTSEVLLETLKKFTGDMTEAELAAKGYSKSQIEAIMQMGKTAQDAATKVKTLTQLIDTTKEAAQSGWTQTWEILVGDFDEAKGLFTGISDVIQEMLNKSAESRNKLLQDWKNLGGRDDLIKGLKNIAKSVLNITNAIKEAFREIFPKTTAIDLIYISRAFSNLAMRIKAATEDMTDVKDIFRGIFSVISLGIDVFKELFKVMEPGVSILGSFASKVVKFGGDIGRFFVGIKENADVAGVFVAISDAINNGLVKIGEGVFIVINSLKEIVKIFEPVFNIIKKIAFDIGNTIQQTFSGNSFDLNSYDFFNLVNGGLIAGILYGVIKMIKSFGKLFNKTVDSFSIVDSIKDIFENVVGILESFQKQIKAETLMKIAKSLALLSVSILILGSIDGDKLANAMLGMTLALGELTLMLAILNKIGDKGTMVNSLKIATSMISISTAVLILSGALKVLSTISLKDIGTSLLAMGGILAEMALFMKLTNTDKMGAIKGISLILFATSITILAGALKILATINLEDIGTSLLALGGLLAEIAVFMKINGNSKNILATGVSMVFLGTGITILAGALKILASMSLEQIGSSLLALGGGLVILSGALFLMKRSIGGAAALTIASASLITLVPALVLLGHMDMKSIGNSLIALAGAFTIIGLASFVLQPIALGMIAVAGAIALLGGGLFAVGAGLFLFAAGMGMLAVSGMAGVTSLSFIVNTLIGLIPMLLQNIAMGIISFAKVIAEGAPIIAQAIVSVIVSIITVIGENTPIILEAIFNVLTQVMIVLTDHLPELVKAGWEFVKMLAKGILDMVGSIVKAAVECVSNFIKGIKQKIGEVIQAGKDMVSGFINGIMDGINGVIEAAKNIGRAALDSLKSVLNIHSPSRETRALGDFFGEGFIIGVENEIGKVEQASRKMGSAALDALQSSLNDISSLSDSDMSMSPVIRPVVDVSNIDRTKGYIDSIFGDGINTKLSDDVGYINERQKSKAPSPNDDQNRGDKNGDNITFVQNNYSPKALDDIEIYRQTKNQLSQIKDRS